MKNECNILRKALLLWIMLAYACTGSLAAPADVFAYQTPRSALGKSGHGTVLLKPPNGYPTAESARPEYSLDPALQAGLNMVLPQTWRNGLSLDAGYDRWEGLPTLRADYFLPVKAWNDKSIFSTQRVSLTGARESFSVGAGFRHLLTSQTMLGFHAFYDWVRPRRLGGHFLREAGVGVEFAALPGRYSDLSVSLNAYLPVNDRRFSDPRTNVIVKETLPLGWDARGSFQLPAMVDWLDFRLNGEYHSYRAEKISLSGYSAGLSANSRNGLFTVSLEHSRDRVLGENNAVRATLNLVFDWQALLEGRQPFSAPYKASSMRFNRKMQERLYDRVVRKHDLPTDSVERPTTLAALVSEETVVLSGEFPIPNSRVTVQVSQSPWRDVAEMTTDSEGNYSGRLALAPGEYRIRLMHKGSGKYSDTRTIVVPDTSRALDEPGNRESNERPAETNRTDSEHREGS
jgi:hypothetical protein